MEFTGNSNVNKKNIEKPTMQPVASGKMNKSNKSSIGKKIFAEGATSVGGHVIDDVIIPKTKMLLSEAGKYIVDFIFFGTKGPKNKTTGYGTTSYQNYYSRLSNLTYNNISSQSSNNAQSKTQVNDKADIMAVFDVGFADRGSAELILLRMKEAIRNFGSVSVADFYDLANIDHSYLSNKYGWTDLSSVGDPIFRGGEWYIPFPQVTTL